MAEPCVSSRRYAARHHADSPEGEEANIGARSDRLPASFHDAKPLRVITPETLNSNIGCAPLKYDRLLRSADCFHYRASHLSETFRRTLIGQVLGRMVGWIIDID